MPSTPTQKREVIIIGSGFGGAVAALRLAEAGYEVTVLERGKRWGGKTPTPFATNDTPDGRAAWLSTTTVDPLHPPTPINRHAGLLDRHESNNMTVLTAAGVGGGSLAFTGALVSLDAERIAHLFPWLDLDHMRRCYDRVDSIIMPTPVPEDLFEDDPHFEQARLFATWVQQAGLTPTAFDMALDWKIVRKELSGEIDAAYTAGQSWYGINSGAKKSLDKNYLAQAEATGHVEIRPLHIVQSISESEDAPFKVSGIEIDEDGTTIRHFTYTSELVFLAAGSLGTTELMLRAKAAGTLPRLARNAAIGKWWGNNGDGMGMHRGHTSNYTHQVNVAQVAAGIGTIHQHEHGQTFVLGDAINGATPGRLLSLAMTMFTNTYRQFGSLAYDAATDQIHIQWDQTLSQRLMDQASQTYTFLDTNSRTRQRAPFTPHIQANMTAHPLGGMALGMACDQHTGHVLGYDHLSVVDGALLPGWAGGVPPALTIAALAEYLLDQFIFHQKR